MKIKSAKSFRYWYKTKIKEIDRNNPTHNENFVGTYHKENGKQTIKGFFEMYHGHKPDIASYLPSILKIAEDGQAIYEFLQNAVDCGSTHFYIFYNEKYFLAINNGSPFDTEGLQSILNIAQTTKKDPDKIGRFGIGFKLAHRLVGKNEGTNELVKQYKGPILFSWSKLEDLESLLKNEQIEPISPPPKGTNNGFFEAPYLLKLLLTNFPSDPDETIKDISYNDNILFPREELNELVDFLNENFNQHSDSLERNVLKQGSLFFIKLGEDKKKLLDKDYSELVNGIQYSMNTLKRLEKVYINDDDIGKIPLQLEEGTIKRGSEEFERISPEYKEFDIKFAIGFNTIKFGNEKSFEQIKLLKEKPNFYKYFPMGDEINGFAFIVHCDSFSNEANRRKLHEDDINSNIFPELANHITQRLIVYKTNDQKRFLNLYASLLLSDIPDRQNNKWLRPIFYDRLLESLQKNIPTKNGFSDNAQSVKINKLKIPLNLSDFGLGQIEWFEWDNETDRLLIDEATKSEKLGIKEWDIRDVVENAGLESINNWIATCEEETYIEFLKELEESYLRKETKEKICQIKLFKFSDGEFYSFNEVVKKQILQNTVTFNYGYSNVFFKTYKNEGIINELNKLEIILSEIIISEYSNIFSSVERIPDEKQMYTFIAEQCKTNTLSAKEKKNLFLNFVNEKTKFDNVAEGTLKDLQMFCDSQGKIKPLSELVSSSMKTFFWLNSYKIKSEEYFMELNKYLIQEDKLFDEIILPNIEIIKDDLTETKEVKELIVFFKDNHRPFFNEYIIQKGKSGLAIIDKSDKYQIVPPNKETRNFVETHLHDNLIVLPYDFSDFNNQDGIIKGEELHSQILELVNIDEHKETLIDIVKYNAKQHFIEQLSEIRFVSVQQYKIEDYEFKILELSCDVVDENNIEIFRKKIIVETDNSELSLSEIPPFIDKIKLDGVELLLSKILPDSYENSNILSVLLEQFVKLGLPRNKLNSLFGVEAEPQPERIFELFVEKVELLENEQQLAFVLLYQNVSGVSIQKFKVNTLDEKSWELNYTYYVNPYSFIREDYLVKEQYSEIKKLIKFPFQYGENTILSAPYFSDTEFLCPQIKNKLNEKEKIDLLAFLFDQWENQEKKSAIKKIDWSKIQDITTTELFGLNPRISVYPTEYACKNEQLPLCIIEWVNEDIDKLQFLSDLGIWTENSVIVELRKYLSDKINFFQNNRLAQETRFNEDETVLFNSFEWLKEKEIELKTPEQFETFKKAVQVINENRDNRDLILQEEFDFEELEKNPEEWKETEVHKILLYQGRMPKLVKLDEVNDYIFYNYNVGDYAINESIIYLNTTEDQKKILQKIASDEENDFTFEELWQLFGEHTDETEILKQEIAKLKQLFAKTNGATLGTDFSTEISKNDQKEANREAKEIIKERLESEGFEFTNGIVGFSTIDGVIKQGIEYPLVVKSYKYQNEPLKIGANEWIQLMRPNSMFWAYFGNGRLGCLKLYELLKNQDRLTISFSTDNLDKDDRLERFAELLHYFGDVHFDFNSVKPSDYSVTEDLGNYRFDERKTEEDLSGDNENLL